VLSKPADSKMGNFTGEPSKSKCCYQKVIFIFAILLSLFVQSLFFIAVLERHAEEDNWN
jgi:hypothetical protein